MVLSFGFFNLVFSFFSFCFVSYLKVYWEIFSRCSLDFFVMVGKGGGL